MRTRRPPLRYCPIHDVRYAAWREGSLCPDCRRERCQIEDAKMEGFAAGLNVGLETLRFHLMQEHPERSGGEAA